MLGAKLTLPESPPPPPPIAPPQGSRESSFHGPETHWFPSLRTHLTILEKQLPESLGKSPRNGLIVALILGATVSIGLSLVFELLVGVTLVAIATVDPLLEEIFKGLSILLVALFVWKTVPSRRYGAVLGASTGLGFAIAENIIYSINYATGNLSNAAELIASRWVGLLFMHVLWDAFIGIGIFVLLAQRSSRQSTPLWLAAPFLLLGLLNHVLWNSLAIALSGLDIFAVILVQVIVIFLPFALILRDFLGGHFDFQDFLKPLQEPYTPQTIISPLPPPPPPPP
jgi:RsiW-degrading membrane proteinase PrsW (M82 family)